MVEYYTRSDFSNYAESMDAQLRASIRKRAEERSPQNATFLSHSSKDADVILPIIKILEDHGSSVYIDKKDQSLPPYTNKETASILRTRIGQSKKFVLLASENSKDSKWVPWELGLADGRKADGNIAIFPVLERAHDTAWLSWEYLGLYDRIVRGQFKDTTKDVWMVLDVKKNTGTELSKWLAQ